MLETAMTDEFEKEWHLLVKEDASTNIHTKTNKTGYQRYALVSKTRSQAGGPSQRLAKFQKREENPDSRITHNEKLINEAHQHLWERPRIQGDQRTPWRGSVAVTHFDWPEQPSYATCGVDACKQGRCKTSVRGRITKDR